MAFGTLLSRITGAIRTIVFLRIGVDALTDTYTAANNTPNMVYELVAGGILSATLVPLFIKLDRSKNKRARDGINAIVSLTAVAMISIVALVLVGAPVIANVLIPGADAQLNRQVGTELLRYFAPQIGVYGFITVATALLNSRRSFFAPMLAPVLNNVVVIIVLLWFRRILTGLTSNQGVSTTETLRALATDRNAKLLLGFGTTAGVLAMGLALLPAVRGLNVGLRWHWEPKHPAVIELLRLSGWTVGYVIANQLALIFVTRAAQRGVDGDLAAYNSAFATFFMLPHGIFAVSIMTALQPGLAEAYLDRKRGRFRMQLAKGIQTLIAVMIPAAVGYLILAEPIVLILRGGALNVEGAERVASVLRAFAVGLPGFSIYLLLMNAFKAMRNTRETFSINVVENAINIALAGLFYSFGFGVVGLAASFSVAYLVSAVLAGYRVSKFTAGIKEREIFQTLARVALSALVMAIFVRGVSLLAHRVFAPTVGLLAVPERLGLLLEVGFAVATGVTVYLAVSRVLGITELDSVVNGLRRKLGFRVSRR